MHPPDFAAIRQFKNVWGNLRNISIWDFGSLINSQEAAVTAAYAWGLVPKTMSCPQCRRMMHAQERSSQKLGFRWRCRRKPHRTAVYVSPTKGTFFEHVKVSFEQALKMMFMFVRDEKLGLARKDCGIGSKTTAVDLYSYFREVCDVTQDHDFIPIGGRDDIVEVDESHLFKRKYHRGRRLRLSRHVWVFGCCSRLTKHMWIERIKDKSRPTLDRIIGGRVKRGSYIMSDYHRSYINIDRRLGFKGHGRVNHSRRFVEGCTWIRGVRPRLGDPIHNNPRYRSCKVHINNIERSWRELKKKLRTCMFPMVGNT
ncbi:hypothetical protein Fcan01_18859 [Folsomia candida]|uniref:ISXO2-like transposase domain-containing protein n=1 Tax=Folsomia candida TaxID=158441 RepID=A0A226DPL8_FOLCA|nr:hypothetical protein Fcan01_18859 [Folsomia candida]